MSVTDRLKNRVRELFPYSAQIVGAGIEGMSSLRFLREIGIDVVLRDRNPQVTAPADVKIVSGDGYLEEIPQNATLMRSAGIRFDLPALEAHRAAGGHTLSQARLFCALHRTLHPKGHIVGVTATMGKGTICTILSEMLTAANVPHAVLGNIGKPMLDVLLEDDVPSTVILELSSFQLSDFAPGDGLSESDISPDVAVFGHVTIEHLDWHTGQVEYWESKANLAAHQLDRQLAVHLAEDPGSVFCGMAGSASRWTLGSSGELSIAGDSLVDRAGNTLLKSAQLRVPGRFQLENVGLAWLAARGLDIANLPCQQGACAFKGLRHRLMWAGEANNVSYYDDSYATRPEATLAAIETFSETPLSLILGGSDKGIDFDALVQGVLSHASIRHVALIGATAPRLREAFSRAGHPPFELQEYPGLPEAFTACEHTLQSSGGALLLSPACASFGLFANYKERGEAFLRLAAERTGETF